MTQEEMKAIGCSSIEDMISEDFGEIGTPERDAFELSCDAFIIAERLKKKDAIIIILHLLQAYKVVFHTFHGQIFGDFRIFVYFCTK
jgi:hypothetical protein